MESSKYLFLAIAAVLGFLIAFLLGYILIPWLHKLKFGQTILDIGPSWHKKKQGTPTMGGILFILGVIFSLAVVIGTNLILKSDIIADGHTAAADNVKVKFYAGILMSLGFAVIGFADDYIKVVKKRNLGLTIIQKSIMQVIVMAAYLIALYLSESTFVFLPFIGNVDIGFWFIPLGLITMYCTVNAVNFTDGIDGLCASVTATFAAAGIVIAIIRNYFGASILCAALFGSLAGYLIWNWHPAKIMMGDTGSMFLGGLVVAVAYCVDAPWLILLCGIVYVLEFLSDIIQISYFKITHGKRIFKMAPIHHHFEKCGWSEKKIVYIFSLVNIIGCALAVLLTYFGRPV